MTSHISSSPTTPSTSLPPIPTYHRPFYEVFLWETLKFPSLNKSFKELDDDIRRVIKHSLDPTYSLIITTQWNRLKVFYQRSLHIYQALRSQDLSSLSETDKNYYNVFYPYRYSFLYRFLYYFSSSGKPTDEEIIMKYIYNSHETTLPPSPFTQEMDDFLNQWFIRQ